MLHTYSLIRLHILVRCQFDLPALLTGVVQLSPIILVCWNHRWNCLSWIAMTWGIIICNSKKHIIVTSPLFIRNCNDLVTNFPDFLLIEQNAIYLTRSFCFWLSSNSLEWFVKKVQDRIVLCTLRRFVVKSANKSRWDS